MQRQRGGNSEQRGSHRHRQKQRQRGARTEKREAKAEAGVGTEKEVTKCGKERGWGRQGQQWVYSLSLSFGFSIKAPSSVCRWRAIRSIVPCSTHCSAACTQQCVSISSMSKMRAARKRRKRTQL